MLKIIKMTVGFDGLIFISLFYLWSIKIGIIFVIIKNYILWKPTSSMDLSVLC